jgi:hypothetical protein
VRLVLRIQDRPSKTLADQLNYDERDDQLVGIAAAFREANPSADIRVITHDIGPRASSKAVGVPCEQVPENWLLAPESDESEKRVKAIQAELDRFKASEPSISLELDGASKGAKDVTGEYVVFPALSEDEIGAAMRALRVRFPACSDFASQEPKKTASGGSAKSGLFDIANFTFEPGRVFTPSNKVEIAQYKDEDYPGWVRNCEKVLRSLHSRMQIQMPRTSLTIRLSNSGSRPAENALVTFVARGTFRIQPPARDDEDAPPRPAFERPPSPPTGRWSSPLDNLWGTVASARVVPSMFDTHSLGDVRRLRDEEAFYWRPSRPSLPVVEFSLECVRWRHQIDPHRFEVELCVLARDDAEAKGVVEVQVHAANLTSAFTQQVPIRITVRKGNTYEEAGRLIEELAAAGK